MKKNKGFSLVELIIVIAIMGVLLTVIAPFFLNYLGKSQLAVCRENRDRIKKDMYNELIMFKNNDLDANAYLDEYMEKGGYKKVSTNTYEGICSTNGVVTFEIDDINSVEAIHVSAKCSVHGGDEITDSGEETEKVDKIPGVHIDSNYLSLISSNKPSSFTIANMGNMSSESERISVKPFLGVNNTNYVSSLKTSILEESKKEGTLLNELKKQVIKDVEETIKKIPNMGITTKSHEDRFATNVIVVTELNMSLGELRNEIIKGNIKDKAKVPVIQYMYVKVWLHKKVLDTTNDQELYFLYATREIEATITGVDNGGRTTLEVVDAMLKGDTVLSNHETNAYEVALFKVDTNNTENIKVSSITDNPQNPGEWKINSYAKLPYEITE